MKRFPRHIAVLLVACLALGLSGCAGKEISVATQTYTAALKQVDDAREAGKINDKTWTEVVVPSRTAAKIALDEMVDSYVAGKDFDWRAARTRFFEALAPILRQREVLQGSP